MFCSHLSKIPKSGHAALYARRYLSRNLIKVPSRDEVDIENCLTTYKFLNEFYTKCAAESRHALKENYKKTKSLTYQVEDLPVGIRGNAL